MTTTIATAKKKNSVQKLQQQSPRERETFTGFTNALLAYPTATPPCLANQLRISIYRWPLRKKKFYLFFFLASKKATLSVYLGLNLALSYFNNIYRQLLEEDSLH